MYTTRNFKTKKALKEAVDRYNAAVNEGLPADDRTLAVTYYQPGPFGGNEPKDGTIYVEGPHSPEPHKWYAECQVANGVIIKVK